MAEAIPSPCRKSRHGHMRSAAHLSTSAVRPKAWRVSLRNAAFSASGRSAAGARQDKTKRADSRVMCSVQQDTTLRHTDSTTPPHTPAPPLPAPPGHHHRHLTAPCECVTSCSCALTSSMYSRIGSGMTGKCSCSALRCSVRGQCGYREGAGREIRRGAWGEEECARRVCVRSNFGIH